MVNGRVDPGSVEVTVVLSVLEEIIFVEVEAVDVELVDGVSVDGEKVFTVEEGLAEDTAPTSTTTPLMQFCVAESYRTLPQQSSKSLLMVYGMPSQQSSVKVLMMLSPQHV